MKNTKHTKSSCALVFRVFRVFHVFCVFYVFRVFASVLKSNLLLLLWLYINTLKMRPITIPLILLVVTRPLCSGMQRDVRAMHQQIKAKAVLAFEHAMVQDLTKNLLYSTSITIEYCRIHSLAWQAPGWALTFYTRREGAVK